MTASLGLHVMLLQTIDVQFLATRALPEVVKWEAAPVRRLWRELLRRRTSWRHKLDRRARRLGERVKRSHSVALTSKYASGHRRRISALGWAQVLAQREEE